MTEDKYLASLIAGCIKLDKSMQMELYRHYYSYAMSICLRYARTRESALEMVNDGFLKVFLKIQQYNEAYEFRPWLRQVLVNAAIDHYRKYKPKEPSPEFKEINPSSSYNQALDNIEFDDLLTIMKQLSPKYQMVFNLYVMENKNHEEIAKQLGISEGTSKSNLFKARLKIKELLKKTHGIHLKT